MTAYIDSSVLLRIVLGEKGALRSWRRIARPISSEIIRVECLRVIDRARIRYGLDERVVAERRAAVLEQLTGFEIVPLDPSVLERAADPFPTLIGSLDALHLTSALAVRNRVRDLKFATHDEELGMAAQAVGFAVIGI